MSLKAINQNILDVENGILFHQVNCQGVMGGGLAGQMREKWPHVFTEYKDFVRIMKKFYMDLYGCYDSSFLLGKFSMSVIKEQQLYIVNVFGQDFFGTQTRQTRYDAVIKALGNFPKAFCGKGDEKMFFPYGMGCGLGGGDWEIVSKIIEYHYPDAIICKKS
jgi:O-acetyl-ADP-ribose deacetylase (regulator of RNase III)